MADKEVKLVLTAEDNISSVIRKVTDALGESGLGQTITAVSTSFLALEKVASIVSNGLQKVYSVVASGVKDAAEAESVNKKLAMSMAAMGQYSEKAFNDVQDWAGALENLTGVSDETYRSLAALGLQYGMNAEQSKKATEAAMNLSAATGQDLNSAFMQMSMTLSGSAGRLSRMVPELRNLTKEELENGKAIDVISQKYNGFASNAANSFNGAQAKIEAQLGNVKEAFGRIIAQNPAVVAAMNKVAEIVGKVATEMDKFATFIINNSDDIKALAISFGIAAVAVGAYVVAINFATISTVALKVATIAFNTALAFTPWGLVIAAVAALTVGIYYLYKNFDLVAGYIKIGLGYAIDILTAQFKILLMAISTVVGVFNADWANSIDNVINKIDEASKSLKESGRAQIEAAKAAKAGGEQQETSAMIAANATAGLTNKIKESEQELIRLESAFSKVAEQAKNSFSAVKDLMPRMNFTEFEKDSVTWKAKVDELRKNAEALKARLSIEIQTDDIKKELKDVELQLQYAAEFEKAIKIKTAIESRQLVIKEEQTRLDQLKQREFSVASEIKTMRLQSAQSMREQLIGIETQRLMEQRGLASLDVQNSATIKQQAILNANEQELQIYKTHLENQKALALNVEQEKSLMLAQMKAANLSQGTAGGNQAAQDVEVIQAQQKQAELARLRNEEVISEKQYQDELTAMRIASIQSRSQMEVALNQQRIEALGMSPEATAAQIEQSKMQSEMEFQMLREKKDAQLLTEQEYQIATEQSQMAHAERTEQIKEQQLQKELQYQTKMKNSWQQTLAQIRLAQQQHGMIMGTLQGVQNSAQYGAMQNALSAGSQLMQSGNEKQFKIGQASAIALTTVNTLTGAIGAMASLSAIPIVGPALGIAAAAMITAAGVLNVERIRSTKPPGASQAHDGMESIPKSMDNSSFILKAGERVVQPSQNEELGKAIEKINSNQISGHTVNVNVSGNADDSAIDKIKTAVIDALREASERGVPVLNEKGLVRN